MYKLHKCRSFGRAVLLDCTGVPNEMTGECSYIMMSVQG